jgi:hypothetical protein
MNPTENLLLGDYQGGMWQHDRLRVLTPANSPPLNEMEDPKQVVPLEDVLEESLGGFAKHDRGQLWPVRALQRHAVSAARARNASSADRHSFHAC